MSLLAMRATTPRLPVEKQGIMLAADRLLIIRTTGHIVKGDATTTGLEMMRTALAVPVTSGGIRGAMTRMADRVGGTETAKTVSPIGEIETEARMSVAIETDQDRKRTSVGLDTRRSIATMTKIETVTVEEAPIAATTIARLRPVEETTTGMSPRLRRLKIPRKSRLKQILRNRQSGHPQHLWLVAKK